MHFLSCTRKKKKREGKDRIGSGGTSGYSTRHGDPWEIQLWSVESVGNVSNVASKYPTSKYISVSLLRLRSVFAIPSIVFGNAHKCESFSSLCVFYRFFLTLNYNQQSFSTINITKVKNCSLFSNSILQN